MIIRKGSEMKKNILSIVMIALLVVNLILNVVIIFSIVPSAKKTNSLVTKICTALDLELEATALADGESTITIDQIATYDIADKLTINLKKSEDGKDHFAVVSVTLSMDNTHEDYEKYGATIAEKESLIKSEIISAMSEFTIDDLQSNRTQVQEAILARLQKLFASEFIIEVAFRDITLQ